MGDNWGSWGAHGRSSNYGRRPPHPQHPGCSNSAVPSWERTFCTSICSIPWGRICAAKASISTYRNIAEWDDEAALEAFQTAKARYWAYINRLPFDIPLPDPDLYIDEVDHMAVIDPKLVEDLEKQPPPLPDEKNDVANGWDSLSLANKPIVPTGWGDPVEENSGAHHSVNWDTLVENANNFPKIGSASNNAWNWNDGWGDNHLPKNGDSGNAWNHSWRGGGNNSSWGQHWNNSSYEQGRGNNRKRNGGNYGSRFSKSRHQANNYQDYNRSWNDHGQRNMMDNAYEKTMRGGQSKSRRYCEPVDNRRSNGSCGGLYWERNVA